MQEAREGAYLGRALAMSEFGAQISAHLVESASQGRYQCLKPLVAVQHGQMNRAQFPEAAQRVKHFSLGFCCFNDFNVVDQQVDTFKTFWTREKDL